MSLVKLWNGVRVRVITEQMTTFGSLCISNFIEKPVQAKLTFMFKHLFARWEFLRCKVMMACCQVVEGKLEGMWGQNVNGCLWQVTREARQSASQMTWAQRAGARWRLMKYLHVSHTDQVSVNWSGDVFLRYAVQCFMFIASWLLVRYSVLFLLSFDYKYLKLF